MSVIIGSARSDETGNITGGKSGDQTGKEVSVQNFYMHKKGWVCLRAKDNTTASLLSLAMSEACDNNNIGYDQNERLSCLSELRKVGVLRKIQNKCETDCSALVRCCCVQAGFDPGNFNTSNEASVLMATGRFTKFDVNNETQIQNGDILVTKTKGHTVIVVNSDNKSSVTTTKSIDDVKLVPAKSKDIEMNGTYVVTASSLNVRRGPSITYSILETLKTGVKVKCYGYYTVSNGELWLLVQTSNIAGFVSAKYLKKV